MVEQASISPTPTTATTSTTSVSTSASSTPTTPTFPSIGDAFKTREELSTLIKGNGKAIGYIFKCSVTSEHKVTYYCSNKYHSPRCMAGFKAAYTKDEGWVVTEATEHNEGCTRARQRVNGIKTPSAPTSKSPSSASFKNRSKPKAKPTPITQSRSQEHKARTSNTSLRASISSSIVTTDIADVSKSNAGFTARTHRSYSTSTAVTSPPSSIFSGSRRGCLPYNTRRTLREVDENEALQDTDDEDDDDQLPVNHGSRATRSSRSSVSKEGKGRKGEESNKGRDRSSSSSSDQSTRSERSHVTTILDPAFHFPPATLEASAVQKSLPCRRKRSASYIKSNAASGVLLGRYLEGQKATEDMAVEQIRQ